MRSKWIKIGDFVRVLSGNHKGSFGKLLVRRGNRVIVEGVNKRKKHLKKRSPDGTGSIISLECPIDISNVALCKEDGALLVLSLRADSSGVKELVSTSPEGEKSVFRTIRKARQG